jgi:hypothetical protein
MVACAYIGLLLSFIGSYCLLRKYPNVFTFLIFIKISYSALFMGFGPQFYLLFNVMFIVLMLLLWFLSYLLVAAIKKYKMGMGWAQTYVGITP